MSVIEHSAGIHKAFNLQIYKVEGARSAANLLKQPQHVQNAEALPLLENSKTPLPVFGRYSISSENFQFSFGI